MSIRNKIKGIQFKTFIFIILFNLGIIIALLLAQNFVFTRYYKNYQIDKLNSMVKSFQTSKKDIYVLAEELAYNNDSCITIYDDNIAYKYNTMNKNCLLDRNNPIINKSISNFITSESNSEYYNITNPMNNTKGLLYSFKLRNKNIFIYNELENSSNYIKAFKSQVVYFILLILLCSLFLSIYVAHKVTKPIREITKKTKELGKGKYNVDFPQNGISEIDELSKTLDSVQKELSRSDEAKRSLLANVSHDLKTPLTMIKAYAEMIRDISYKDYDKMNEHLDIIMDESDRLTNLVNDVLELSKTHNNAYLYNYEEYDLVKEIKEIVKRYQVMKDTENYDFVLELPKRAKIKADKKKINQVIYNLLNNAINWTGKDKKVTIKVTKEPNDYLVEIIDTGKGIKEEELPYIWDKYYKNEKNHQRNVVSTGLGLSIVKEILTKHNFEYGVKSEEGKGAIFYFKISLE